MRRDELSLTIVLFSLYALVLCAHYFLKPARDALFLAGAGPASLPLVFMLSAVVSAPLTTLMTTRGGSLPIHRLMMLTYAILALFLVGLRALVSIEASWVDYTFYIWVGIFGAVTTSQFWLLASSVFDSTQAKRLFAVLGTGGIVGAMAGGELTGFLVGRGLAPEDLLWIAAGVLPVASLLGALAWRLAPKAAVPRTSGRRGAAATERGSRALWGQLRGRPHLALTMAILAIAVSVGTLVDFQFKTVAYGTFSDTSALTSFFGTFYARVSGVALVVQLLLSSRLLSGLGTAGSLFVLPITLAAGTVSMIVNPSIVSAIVLRGGEMTWKYSVDKTARELLFLPLPAALKREAKVTADLFVDRWFRGLAGLVLLLLTTGFGFGVRGVAVAAAVLLVVWIGCVIRMRPAYTDAFRRMLAGEGGAMEAEVSVTDPALLASFADSLDPAEPGAALHMLRLAGDTPSAALDARLPDLLSSPSTALRRTAIEAMVARGTAAAGDGGGAVHLLLLDPDAAVRREAAHYMWRREGAGWLAATLATDDEPLVAAVLDALALHGSESDLEAVSNDRLEALVSRTCGATLRHAIMRFAARRRDPEVAEWILARLGSRTDRSHARAALAAYGPGVLEALAGRLGDPMTKPAIRRAIVYVIAEIPDDDSVRTLLDELGAGDRELRPHLIRALHRLRRRFPDLAFPAADVRHALEDEAVAWFAAAEARVTLAGEAATPALRLLLRALDDRREQATRRVFRLLALLYDAEAMGRAYDGVITDDRAARANAREFVEQTLGPPERTCVLPMLDHILDPSGDDVFEAGERLFGLGLREPAATLRYFVTGADVWLASAAIWASGAHEDETLAAEVRDAQYGRYPLIRETARLALGRRSA